MKPMKKVLFLCVGNSCSSQMTEGFTRYYGKGIIESHSAGTMPATTVSKTAIRVMKEKGVDISRQEPELLDPSTLKDYDILISMGCGVEESCPVVYLKDFIDWGLEDPIGQPVENTGRLGMRSKGLCWN
jgi:arsenate reductase